MHYALAAKVDLGAHKDEDEDEDDKKPNPTTRMLDPRLPDSPHRKCGRKKKEEKKI
jgi:hypothetical protein